MKSIFIFILASSLAFHYAAAQQAGLFVKSGQKGLYLEHHVAPKEGLYSIGRLYSVHPKNIAAYNEMDLNKGLAIGEVIRIPLSDTNFTQKGNSGTPVYYMVGERENLAKVSSLHKNVSIENLRNWNNLTGNATISGTRLVVGFLTSKEIPSVTISRKEPVSEPIKQEPKSEQEKPVMVSSTEVTEKKPQVKEEPKSLDPVKSEPPAAKQDARVTGSESGYFKYHFDQQIKRSPARKDETVTSGIFKTSSGWMDAKYYLLMDNVQPGTIVKITNPSNNKFIFAKVLGEMSGIIQNAGLNIRISNAGASALEITEVDKFIVKVNY